MKIVVVFTTESRHDLLQLLASRLEHEGDAVSFGEVYLEEMEQQFLQHEGPPPGATIRTDCDGTVWWWRYVNGLWTGFTISDQQRLFRPTVRTINVLAFRVRPPTL